MLNFGVYYHRAIFLTYLLNPCLVNHLPEQYFIIPVCISSFFLIIKTEKLTNTSAFLTISTHLLFPSHKGQGHAETNFLFPNTKSPLFFPRNLSVLYFSQSLCFLLSNFSFHNLELLSITIHSSLI